MACGRHFRGTVTALSRHSFGTLSVLWQHPRGILAAMGRQNEFFRNDGQDIIRTLWRYLLLATYSYASFLILQGDRRGYFIYILYARCILYVSCYSAFKSDQFHDGIFDSSSMLECLLTGNAWKYSISSLTPEKGFNGFNVNNRPYSSQYEYSIQLDETEICNPEYKKYFLKIESKLIITTIFSINVCQWEENQITTYV